MILVNGRTLIFVIEFNFAVFAVAAKIAVN